MKWGHLRALAPVAGVFILLGTWADAGLGSVAPPLKPGKLTSCLQLHGGLPDTTGVRSKAFSYGVDLDPNVGALVVVSGTNPHPGITTSILTRGRKPFLTKRFANLRIDAYVFHRNGVAPVPHAIASATQMATKTINLCVAASH